MCSACERAHPFPQHDHSCLCGSPETFAAMRRIEADITRRRMLGGAAAVLGMFAGFGIAPVEVRAQAPGRPLLLTNLRLFDGRDLAMREGVAILVEGDRIAGLPPAGEVPEGAEVIDCGGRAVIPGLIDAHWHATLTAVSQIAALTQDIALVHLIAGREAGATLRRGFTTVRDVGGPAFGLKAAIDRGVVEGPRIFPSGAAISQTSGHGDYRMLHALPRMPGDPADYSERTGVAVIADGPDEVLRRVREQLMQGASQIKIHAGGGVSSVYDPLDSVQFTEPEMRAAVQAAADWGTYVCAHVYLPEGIQRAVRAGVRSIEHGQLADEETARIMAGEGVWWSIQPFLLDEDANAKPDPAQRADQARIAEGTVRAFDLGRSLGVRMAFGTDILFNAGEGGASQGRQLAKLARFMPPLEALRMATGNAGELLALSGGRAPYPAPLGVIAPGAHADLLVVEGDPEAGLDWLGDPEANLRLILKGGRIVKEMPA
ncbi:metal-dependent hydrolase family protein [Rubellimicrobium aerolatum]|uniref:Amidohydrolase family protein n=1 Tax=Rubellimicrobium aerolatum TaxID=490979 RepID=A0ABW0SCC0_9RHOB|nr:amidohydrolase family protein [Rubellimicrobium aerolatum]MBP1806205.1 imidazolonepropionase-like amidohydrolase [Rubellimicrobium aerolatum]